MYKLDRRELETRHELRGRYAPGAHWYAVMAHCGREARVQAWIEENLTVEAIEEAFLPIVEPRRPSKRSSSSPAATVPKFLFRSYLFLRCAMTDAIYTSVCAHPLVFQMLGRGYRIPAALDDEEIGRLRQVLRADCDPELVASRNIGEVAEIVEGLMAGIQGRIVEVNSRGAKLEVPFSFLDMGTTVAVVVPRDNLRIRSGYDRESLAREEACYV